MCQISKINTASQMITSINATVGCNAQIWHIYFPTPSPGKGSISALELAIVTLSIIVKQKERSLQWYTIQLYTSFPNKSINIWFTKYSKLSVGT